MQGTNENLNGVQGWLLVLCVFLGILDPLSGILSLSYNVQIVKPYFDEDPGLRRFVLITGVYSVFLIVYSFYAGVSLWKKTSGAVKTAKQYFIALALNVVFVFIVLYSVGLSEKNRHEILEGMPLNAIVIVYALIWYRYLAVSKRVKTTYQD